MKLFLLPMHLIEFWYPEALCVFIRIWKNTLLYLEEDLGVGVMFKLLFVPLFHDSSFVGRILSFFFRSFRIFIGLFGILIFSLLLIAFALTWFALPVILIIAPNEVRILAGIVSMIGFLIFLHHVFTHPHQKLWKIKELRNIWNCSYLHKADFSFAYLLTNPRVKELVEYLEIDIKNLEALQPNTDQETILNKVWEIGKKLSIDYLYPEYFFIGMLFYVPSIDNLLVKFEVSTKDFLLALEFLKNKYDYSRTVWIWDDDFQVRHLKGVNRGWLSVPTPNLDLVSEDLTKLAGSKSIPDFIGRTEALTQVVNHLSETNGRNVVIVGDPGSGRTTLVMNLAKKIVTGNAPVSLASKRLVSLDFTRLLAGITTQGELAERIKNVFDEVNFCGNIIVFIDEVQNLGVGEAGSVLNVYSLLLPFIESTTCSFVLTADPQGYTKVIERDREFARLFAKVSLPPASPEESLQILENRVVEIEKHQKIKVSIPALKELVALSQKYITEQVLPDSALHLLDSSIVLAKDKWVKKVSVEEAIQEQVHVPVGEVAKEQKQELLNLESIIHLKFIDQIEAVNVIASALRRAAVQIQDQKRPLGSFLFVGPTGVGKTELAKILADIYFAGKGKFLRFDMSEYQTSESVHKLIGKSDEDGQMTEDVRRNPYSLILLDEFEKADPTVLTIFLQVLEDGRLTDGRGKTIDFTNTIIIATSNAGSVFIAEEIAAGKKTSEIETQVEAELMKVFKPELINRFDDVVIFKPLAPEDLEKIVRLKLASLQKSLSNQGYLVNFSDLLVHNLAQRGYSPVMGARPLRRLIQDTIEARLSVMILEDKLPKGSEFLATEQLLS